MYFFDGIVSGLYSYINVTIAQEARSAEFRSMLRVNCLCSGRDFHRAVPAMLSTEGSPRLQVVDFYNKNLSAYSNRDPRENTAKRKWKHTRKYDSRVVLIV